MINYDKERGVTVTKDKTGSTMFLKNAIPANSGNYTCKPNNIPAASVLVHVLTEGNSAAQLRSSGKDLCNLDIAAFLGAQAKRAPLSL